MQKTDREVDISEVEIRQTDRQKRWRSDRQTNEREIRLTVIRERS